MRPSPRLLSAPLSAVHRGVAFEERSRRILQTYLSMSLGRVGGKSDGGIDLQGWWWLPPPSAVVDPSASLGVLYTDSGEPRRRVRVIGQCKAEAKKMGPNYVREMEGVQHTLNAMSAPAAAASGSPASQTPCVALLISQSAFTRSTLLRAMSSPLPFMLMHLPPLTPGSAADGEEEKEDQIGAAMWNAALGGEDGLLRGEAELRWERKVGDVGRPGLWWGGKKLRNWVPPETIVDGWLQEEKPELREE